jgi:hypothetical protein
MFNLSRAFMHVPFTNKSKILLLSVSHSRILWKQRLADYAYAHDTNVFSSQGEKRNRVEKISPISPNTLLTGSRNFYETNKWKRKRKGKDSSLNSRSRDARKNYNAKQARNDNHEMNEFDIIHKNRAEITILRNEIKIVFAFLSSSLHYFTQTWYIHTNLKSI